MQRRRFIQLLSAGTPALLSSDLLNAKSTSDSGPVVISTWEPNTKANETAWNTLQQTQNTLDAVHQGVMIPEADPEDTSVGYGGLPDRDGKVTLDACIMDHLGNIGSVMGLEQIRHASSVARLVMEKTPHVQLVGEGALQFALDNGFKAENLLTEKAEKAWKEWLKTSNYDPLHTVHEIEKRIEKNHDTIGMLAMNSTGDISGACSTSGMAFKMRGRVGDSPIIGSGLYVNNKIGAATATGVGEEVVRICGAHTIVEAMRYGYTPQQACKLALERLIELKGEKHAQTIQIGFIALHKSGEIGCYSMLPNFTMAVRDQEGAYVIKAKSIFE
ncbi:MAG: N(4)-(beta-N-acetylglucosaminyl)-L-asparaginase [Chitinophagaceae bacterium]|nr:N(4)-(beta-N-acetylglucosaminyl)-L-asparaginase [Chitinophagaceae bacterium]